MKPLIWGIESYVFMTFLGALLFLTMSFIRLKLSGNSTVIAINLVLVLWLSAIGARVLYSYHFPMEDFGVMDYIFPFTSNGFAVYGGLITGGLLLVISSKILKTSYLFIMDKVSPGILLGLAVGRVGCFLGGCCYGKIGGGLFGVTYPYGSEPHKWQMVNGFVSIFEKPLIMHPTQLYELVFLLVIAVLCLKIEKSENYRNGYIFFFALGSYSLFRLINLSFRVNPSGSLPTFFYHTVYSLLIGFSIYSFRKRMAK